MVTEREPATLSFHCHACGKCCNSPPLMTVAELLRHQHRFVGSLGMRRTRALAAGARFAAAGVAGESGATIQASVADATAFAELASRQGHALPAPSAGSGEYLVLAAQGFDYPSLARCPALGEDQRCTIHAQRPSTCAMVPLDAWVPDGLQQVALAAKRAGEHYIGADCIAAGLPPGYRPLVRGPQVLDDGFAAALAARRDDEAREKTLWGNHVFRLLQAELLGPARGIDSVPLQGQRALPLALVLRVLAAASDASRERCLEYGEAQRALIAHRIALAVQRRHAADKPVTAVLRGFDAAWQALAAHLRGTAPATRAVDPAWARDVECYLGLRQPAGPSAA